MDLMKCSILGWYLLDLKEFNEGLNYFGKFQLCINLGNVWMFRKTEGVSPCSSSSHRMFPQQHNLRTGGGNQQPSHQVEIQALSESIGVSRSFQVREDCDVHWPTADSPHELDGRDWLATTGGSGRRGVCCGRRECWVSGGGEGWAD